MTTQQIEDPSLYVRPSAKLRRFIRDLETNPAMTPGVASINNNTEPCKKRPLADHRYLLTDQERAFLNSLGPPPETPEVPPSRQQGALKTPGQLLNLDDIHWLHDALNKASGAKVYFHELFEGSEVVLPENVVAPRDPELERRCAILKAQQQNVQYKAMTKNVDTTRHRHPEDTFAYQLKQLDRHLIAVAQFIISVGAGFAFGFVGLQLLVGSLDFGFRILLGVICALVIALAELYFLAKKLNEDLNFEASIKTTNKGSKIN